MITILSFVCKFVREREREREEGGITKTKVTTKFTTILQLHSICPLPHTWSIKNKSILCVFNEFFKHQSYIQLAFSHNSIIREKRLQFNNHSWYKRRISDTGTIKQK